MESFKPFVGVFLKKFIKFSHKTGFISLVISFILRNSVCTCFLTIFLSYNCYYEKYSDGSVKNIQDEIPFDLPDSWSWERLSNLAAFSGGKTPSTSNRDYWGGNILWVTSKDMKSKYIDSSLLMISEKSLEQMQLYPENTLLLVTRSGILRHTIPVAILKKPATINQDLKAIMPYALNLGEYIYICIKGMESRLILEYTKAGATVENINFDAFQKILLPIPPENQIQRIVLAVNKVDEIIVKLKIDQDDLIDIIGKTKSKILELAIQGKLVPQDENDEPATVLLERIRAERKAKLGKKYVESYIYKGDDNCYYEKIGSATKNITDEIPFDIPDSWCFIRLKELIKIISGVSYDKRDICADGIRILRGGNIGELTIQLQQDDVFLPYKYYEEEKQVKNGDIVIVASTGSKIAIGRAGFAEKDYPNTQIGAFLRIVRPINIDFADYLKCLFSTDYYREHIRESVHGNTINNVKSEYLENFIISLPPVAEQKRVIQQTKSILALLKDEA